MRRSHRRAFTLIEVLIAILIIVTLIALLFPAVAAAMRSARRAAVAGEIDSLVTGIASYAMGHGDKAPPSRLVCSETGDYSANFFKAQWPTRTDRDYLRARSLADLVKFAPRARMSTLPLNGVPNAVSGCGWYDFNGNGKIDVDLYELDGSECLPFFLGGIPQDISTPTSGYRVALIGFATDPRNPFQPVSYVDVNGVTITPPRSPSTVEFRSDRLVDFQDGDGMPAYADCYSGSGELTPYVYFKSVGYRQYDPSDVDFTTEPNGDPMPTGAFGLIEGNTSSPGPNPYCAGPALPVTGAYATGALSTTSPGYAIAWINPDGYQILCAGDDRRYGIGGLFDDRPLGGMHLPFPGKATSTVTGQTYAEDPRQGERDNLTNFSGGPLD